jgi:chromosome segregation ATPase
MDDDQTKNNSTDPQETINSLKDKLNKANKKNQKLEEGYIKLHSELKNLKNDKVQIETFLKIIFPKETHERAIHSESGLYEADELQKNWLISETQKENQFQKILNQSKDEIAELTEKIKNLEESIADKNKELKLVRKNLDDNQEQLSFYINTHKSLNKKTSEIENEKEYLLGLIEAKNKEIEKLQGYELEIAEMKAQYLLMDGMDNDDYDEFGSNVFKHNSNSKHKNITIDRTHSGTLNVNTSNHLNRESSNTLSRLNDENTKCEYKLRIGKIIKCVNSI